MVSSTSAAVTASAGSGLVRAGTRAAAQVAFEREMVAFFVDAAELLGVPESIAAIYGIVFAAPEPLTFAEIEERLDFSKGSISQGMKVLREIGAVQEVSTDHERKARFSPDLELRRLIQRFVEQRLETQLARGKSRLTALKQHAVSFPEAQQEVLTLRLHKLRRWHDRANALMPVMKAFLKLTKL